jgi:hypothetical protein
MVLYLLALIMRRKGNWLHGGSNPSRTTTINNLKLKVMPKTEKQLAQERADAFHNWMQNKVKSVHMADNAKMSEAYIRIYKAK